MRGVSDVFFLLCREMSVLMTDPSLMPASCTGQRYWYLVPTRYHQVPCLSRRHILSLLQFVPGSGTPEYFLLTYAVEDGSVTPDDVLLCSNFVEVSSFC